MKWLVIVALASAACSKTTHGAGASCKEVVRHMQDLAAAAHDDRLARELAGSDPVKRCEDAKLTGAERTCMLGAKSLAAIEVCGQNSEALKRDRARAEADRAEMERAQEDELAKFQHERDAKLDAGATADAR